MRWILLILLIGSGNGSGADIDQIEFSTEELCLTARSRLLKANAHRVRFGDLSAECVQTSN